MKRSVLIASMPGDVHAFAVREALLRKGLDVVLWLTPDFPALSTETFRLSNTLERAELHGPDMECFSVSPDVVWNRRVAYSVPSENLTRADGYFAELECKAFREGFLRAIVPGAFWVNPWAAARNAEHKIFQLHRARAQGLLTPTTLVTNNPTFIRTFHEDHDGKVVYKPLRGIPWKNENSTWACYTSSILAEDLASDEALSALPGIYQEKVEKDYELRVTAIGNKVFAARINSQATRAGKTDWRLAYDELTMEPAQLSDRLQEKCLALLTDLGLVFGCLDFIVKPNGDHVFLEINEQGQFLFVERYCGLPLLEAFASFLAAASPDYQLPEPSQRIKFLQVLPAAKETALESLETHRQVESLSAKEEEAE